MLDLIAVELKWNKRHYSNYVYGKPYIMKKKKESTNFSLRNNYFYGLFSYMLINVFGFYHFIIKRSVEN